MNDKEGNILLGMGYWNIFKKINDHYIVSKYS